MAAKRGYHNMKSVEIPSSNRVVTFLKNALTNEIPELLV